MRKNTQLKLTLLLVGAAGMLGHPGSSLARSHTAHSGPLDGDKASCFVENGGVVQRDCSGEAAWNIPLDNENTANNSALRNVRVIAAGGGVGTGRVASCHWFTNSEFGTELYWDLAGKQTTDSPESQLLRLTDVQFKPNGVTYIKCHMHQGTRVLGVSY